MPYWGSTVSTLNKSMNGSTQWFIPMVSDFECIMCHTVAGARRGETISMWNRDARGAESMSSLEVSGGRRRCLGARCDIRDSISADQGTLTSPEVIYSGFTITAAGRRSRRMSLEKVLTFPSSSVGWAKDRFTN